MDKNYKPITSMKEVPEQLRRNCTDSICVISRQSRCLIDLVYET